MDFDFRCSLGRTLGPVLSSLTSIKASVTCSDMPSKTWTKTSIKEALEKLAISKGYVLTEITEKLDHALDATPLSQWMDKIGDHYGGWYHRVKHGHDFAANVGDVYDQFGWDGVCDYPFELLRDACTPHGIPVPGTEFLVNADIVSAKTATEWLSLNVADVFSGGLAVYSTYRLAKKKRSGELDPTTVIWASIGIGIKISSGVATTNPILIISGLADAAILITSPDDLKKAKSWFFEKLKSDPAKAAYIGAGAGLGVTAATVTAVGAFGTASTGTAIATLSGAAATNATFAAIGGGSLAAGGLGIAGGMAILSTGGIAVALGAGYFAYRHFSNRVSSAQ